MTEHLGSGLETAVLEVRVLPWRPRRRVMHPDRLRELVSNAGPIGGDDIAGVFIGLGLWLAILIAAPLIVLVLAAGLFSVELPLIALLGALLLVARFAGLIPWTVVILDRVTGDEPRDSYRNLLHALGRIRELNADRRVLVRWAWV